MTLPELLVVILIMTLLLATALPVMRTAVEDRAMREASRQLNTYVQLAKSQAAERGRPVGLWLETQSLAEGIPTDARYCQQLFLAETPPPYAGDVVGARIRLGDVARYEATFATSEQQTRSSQFFSVVQVGDLIRFGMGGSPFQIVELRPAEATVVFERQIIQSPCFAGDHPYTVHRGVNLVYAGEPPPGAVPTIRMGSGRYQAVFFDAQQQAASTMFFTLVNVGDHIRFDAKGSAYEIDRLPPNVPAFTIGFVRQPTQSSPVGRDVGYQVSRTPQKSSLTPMPLAAGAVIDLSVSGVGLTGREFAAATTPIVIMFSPTGAVDRILGQGLPSIAPGTIHLLVGNLTNMMEEGVDSVAFSEPYNRNLEVNANLWVSVGHQTGSVITAPNAWESRVDFLASLGAAREFSERRFATGGR